MTRADESAFPMIGSIGSTDGDYSPGLTKREYFAGLAMQGLLSAWTEHDCEKDPVFVARDATQIADALLAALAGEKEK